MKSILTAVTVARLTRWSLCALPFMALAALTSGCELDYEGGFLNVNINASDGLIGLNWNDQDARSGQAVSDRDGDGVPDVDDLCPDDPVAGNPEWFSPPGCNHPVATAGTPVDATEADAQADASTGVDAYRPCGVGPSTEICNGVDDDCDGVVDELLGVGLPCISGVGACAVAGSVICDEGGATQCDAVAGQATVEVCNFQDDDCDGLTDEDFGLGVPCVSGTGDCSASGVTLCMPDGTAGCSAAPMPPGAEVCDQRDNDCDGVIDNGCP